MMNELKQIMWRQVGPFRDKTGLQHALAGIDALQRELRQLPVAVNQAFASELFDWYELRAALLVAESVARAALSREESRGAHQREDFPHTSADLELHQRVSLQQAQLSVRFV